MRVNGARECRTSLISPKNSPLERGLLRLLGLGSASIDPCGAEDSAHALNSLLRLALRTQPYDGSRAIIQCLKHAALEA